MADGVSAPIVSWINDYLIDRPQFVHPDRVLSYVVVSGIGAPQGTVFSPFLFTFYTTGQLCHLQNFSDDSAVEMLDV